MGFAYAHLLVPTAPISPSERWWILRSRTALVRKVARRKDFDVVAASEREPENEPLPGVRRGAYALTAIAARIRSKALVLCGDADDQFGRVATRGVKVPKRPTFREFDRAPRTFTGRGLVASTFWIQIDFGYDSRPSRAALTRHGVELAAPALVALAERRFGLAFGQGFYWA